MTQRIEKQLAKSNIIELKKEPEITYNLIEQKGVEVQQFASSILLKLPNSQKGLKSV